MTARHHRHREKKTANAEGEKHSPTIAPPTKLQRYQLLGVATVLVGWFLYLIYVAFIA